MRIEQCDEVLARIRERARAVPGGVVATDGDGTLWSGDVGDDFYEALLERRLIRARGFEAMTRAAREHGIDPGGDDASALGHRLWDAYRAGAYPEEPFYELMTWCFAGFSPDEAAALARDVLVAAKLADRLHAEVARVLGAVRSEGIDVFLVSASPRAIVEAAASYVGIDHANVIAATPRYDGAGMMPEVLRPIPYHAGKVARLRERTAGRVLYAAFGDNAFDAEMLASAEVPVAVRPKPKLRDRAAEVPGLVELGRVDA
jgi:phosphoserine phosphatase